MPSVFENYESWHSLAVPIIAKFNSVSSYLYEMYLME